MSSGFRAALTTLIVVALAGATMDVMVIRAHAGAKDEAVPGHYEVKRVLTTDVNHAAPFRVCADPNNMPFSNARREGFENALAELVARDLGREVQYTWWPQRRGFIRNTLAAGTCDVVMGIPSGYQLAQATHPYYRSGYVFVSRRDRRLDVRSFDDPRLKQLTIGVHTIGDDYNNVPPMQMLAIHGLAPNIRGYRIYGDYSQPDPPRQLIDAVAKGEVDIAIAWGPIAGYFARHEPVPMSILPVQTDAHLVSLPMQFDIALGVRRGNDHLKNALEQILVQRRSEIAALLAQYGVPTMQRAQLAQNAKEQP